MTRFDASEHHTLAVDAATDASSCRADAPRRPVRRVERMPSTSTSMSAQRCFTAWKLPIGRPNCTRSLAYSTAMSIARDAPPEHLGRRVRRAPVEQRVDRVRLAEQARPGVPSRRSQPSSRVRSIAGSRAGRSRSPRSTSNSAGPSSVSATTTATVADGAYGVGSRPSGQPPVGAGALRSHGIPIALQRDAADRVAAQRAARPSRRGPRARARRARAPSTGTAPARRGARSPPAAPRPRPRRARGRPRPPAPRPPVHPCSTMAFQSSASKPAAGFDRPCAPASCDAEPVEQLARAVAQRELVVRQLEVHRAEVTDSPRSERRYARSDDDDTRHRRRTGLVDALVDRLLDEHDPVELAFRGRSTTSGSPGCGSRPVSAASGSAPSSNETSTSASAPPGSSTTPSPATASGCSSPRPRSSPTAATS